MIKTSKPILPISVVVLAFVVSASVANGGPPPSTWMYAVTAPMMGELDGKALKFIRVAEPVFKKEHLDVNQGVIVVGEDDEAVEVVLTTRERLAEAGVGGPGFVVRISKTDMRILSGHYLR
jgi:hypothetical protein